MRSRTVNMKAKVGGRVLSGQQVAFELKQKVVLALNKLSDRDTNHLGVEELEKMVHCLGPEGITPFLSGIVETDSEQKSAVRKECVRIMGILARSHSSLLAPHLGKMVASVVKRLKDTDSVVRDACVETVGVFASSIVGCGDDGDGESGGAFVMLAKPLFDALGEQNRYVQGGAALCLARVIDESSSPPPPILQPMLNRVIKLLKNPHFMAKPALIELVRSIIQAGGATTELVLSAAITSITDALKNSDWTTRKAASVALAGIATNYASYLGSFQHSIIRSLECCRFDKVKPVRDAVLHALQCWKTLPVSGSLEISETGSSTKENSRRFLFPEASSVSDDGWGDKASGKGGPVSALSTMSSTAKHKRAPLSVRKTCPNYVQHYEHLKYDDWNVEISVPKTHTIPSRDPHDLEFEGCITRTSAIPEHGILEEVISYKDDDDKPDCSSVSDLISGSFEAKHVSMTIDECESTGHANMSHGIVKKNTNPQDLLYTTILDHKSPDSTITDCEGLNDCCRHTSNELMLIRKQLLEIESRQSSLLDLLQVFMGNSMDSLSMLQSKVQSLESAIDKIVGNLLQTGNHQATSNVRLPKKSQTLPFSPRLSNCTPRQSTDVNCRQASRLSVQSSEHWEENESSKSRSSSVKETADFWRDFKLSTTATSSPKVIQKNVLQGSKSSLQSQTRKGPGSSTSACNSTARSNTSECKNSFWKRIKDFICARDVEAAYMEALCIGDDLVLVELMNRTGPVLERLSDETANEILCVLATHILDHRFIDSIIPWLQQVVDLCSAREPNHLRLSAKVRKELLLSVQEASSMEVSSPMESESLAPLALQLRRIWCEERSRATCNPRKHEVMQSIRVPTCK